MRGYLAPGRAAHGSADPRGRRRLMCGWPPAGKGFLALRHRWSLAVMCPACRRGRRPQAPMGPVARGLIKPAGLGGPIEPARLLSSRRLTDHAITLPHPRKPSGADRAQPVRPPAADTGSPPGGSSALTRSAPSRWRARRRPACAASWRAAGRATGPAGPAEEDRHRAVDQQPAEIAIAALADRTELELAAGFPLRADHEGRP
jgi:hypothetical protein